jgi:hypothetical protein
LIIRRCLILSVFILVALQVDPAAAQQFEWGRLHLGLSGNVLLPQDDFGKFWGTAPAVGATLRYDLDGNFSLLGEVSAASFVIKSGVNKAEIPNFYYVVLSSFMTHKIISGDHVWADLGVGMSNHTFAFHGPAARLYDQNVTESEFAFAGTVSLSFFPPLIPLASLAATYHHILAFPEPIGAWSVGLVLYVH